MTYLLDTNVLSELFKDDEQADPAVVAWWNRLNAGDDEWLVPAPVLAEIAAGIWSDPSPSSKARRRSEFDRYCALHSEFFCDWDGETARTWGELQYSPAVKRQPQALWDSLIDAMAVRHGFRVATRNSKDFRHADTFNPWES